MRYAVSCYKTRRRKVPGHSPQRIRAISQQPWRLIWPFESSEFRLMIQRCAKRGTSPSDMEELPKFDFSPASFQATFGLVPWSAIPQLPAEFILMPASSPLNIYTLSSWARSTLIPVLIARHHEPVYPLPNGLSPNNDFLDELWCDPNNKNVPFAPSLSKMFWQRDFTRFGFTAVDKIIAQLEGLGLKQSPLRALARRKCVEWLLEHQESTGEWAGFFPPIHGSI